MDLLDKLEIYIPVDAEVKSIPLGSLPKSVLRRMGLLLSDADGSRKLKDSPEGIWICPAVIRTKGQKVAPHTGHSGIENMSLLLGREVRAAPGPFQMSFISANRTAYKVLKDTMPGKNVSAQTSHSSLLPQGSAPQTYKDAVVIYQGRVYLSARKPSHGCSQQKKRQPRPASHSSIPSASDVSSNSQKKELLNDNKAKQKRIAWKVISKNETDALHKVSDVSSSTASHHVAQSSASMHSHHQKDADREPAAEEAVGTEPGWFQPLEEREEASSNGSEHQIQDQSHEEADDLQTGSVEPDSIVGIEEQRSSQTLSSRECQGAARALTSLPEELDFEMLEQQEKIAQMRAKLAKMAKNKQKRE
ncbi:uncharacterized protein si:dkeyp-110g5.4 [Plectropomus leopardus]|uniref:uncharacterized protein si:dkeyp-110g5.4 n=1 Tax=Plectropomus leopardus TaxID=160734 RepID=UPI001C4CB835|nr:uncharacterized protein si:dkeyp-110g5.4 [Plectropomus leopardus]